MGNQESTKQQIKPEITKPTKINFNRFTLNNNNKDKNLESNLNGKQIETPIKQKSPITTSIPPIMKIDQVKPVAQNVNPNPEPSIPGTPPMLYENNEKDESNADDWNDDDTPPKIQPSYAANVDDWNDDDTPPKIQPSFAAKVDEWKDDAPPKIPPTFTTKVDNDSNNNNNNNKNQHHQDGNKDRHDDIYENFDDDENNGYIKPQSTTVENNSNHGKKAIALYDFIASEPDELSFDPNDTIENIQMVRD